MAVLGTPEADLYDWDDTGIGDGEDEALVGAPGPGYRQVADVLRERIRSGKYAPGTAIPGQQALARDLRADVAVVNRAVGQLAREGLVGVAGHGRPTIVLEQRRWRALAAVPWLRGDGVPYEVMRGVRASFAAADDAAVSDLVYDLTAEPRVSSRPVLSIRAVVLAADGALAVTRLLALASGVLRDPGGWDLAGASVHAEPADEEGRR